MTSPAPNPALDSFVGRERELSMLRSALDGAGSGSGRLVIVSGEPGIGKTRLARELTDHAAEQGAHVVWGYCHEEAGAPPYWPWARAIRAITAAFTPAVLRASLGAGAPDIAELVPELRERLPDLDPPTPSHDPAEARFRLFGSLTEFLVNLSRHQPLVLVLDDLHWADVPSLRLLAFLAPEIARSRLLLIGTYRETGLSRRHPLSDTLGALVRLRQVERLRLSGLGADAAYRFIVAAAGMTPPSWLTHAIHGQTEGNPLFLREVVRFLHQQGHLRPGMSAAQSAIRIPEGVREVIGRRLNLLSPACNEVLTLAAVIGRNFALDVLMRASGARGGDAVQDAVDEALAAHVIEETEPGQYQFTHMLVRMTLYDELRTGQRQRLHRIVGEAIAAQPRRNLDPVLPDLARHFQAAGVGADVERAIDYATRAGQQADTLLAFEDAIGFFQAALDMLDQAEDVDQLRRCGLLLMLGDAQRKANDFPGALETLRLAAAIARGRGCAVLLARIALTHESTAWRQGVLPDSTSEALLEEALRGLPEAELALRAQVTGRLARARLYAGAVPEAKVLASRAVAMSRTLGDPAVLATSLSVLATFAWEPHETRQALAERAELVAVAERAGNLEVVSQGHFVRVLMSLELGDIQAAEREIDVLAGVIARIRQPVFTLYEISLRALLALLRGELQEVERLILRGMRIQRGSQAHNTDPLSILIFGLRREQGRLAEVGPLLSLFLRQSPVAGIWKPGLVLLHIELGDLPAARAVFEELAADGFASLPHDSRRSTCLAFLAEACAALGESGPASVLYDLLMPWAGYAIVLGGGTGCWGSSGRFLGLLATTMARWMDAETHFAEALAMNERIGARVPLAHTRHDFAGMLLARGFPGDRERAEALLRSAQDSAHAMGLVALSGRVADRIARLASPGLPPAAPDGLTTRECEVLRLMAIGRGNADIALVLDISLNTVATHVRNILAKTGCANRTEAAAYAMRHGMQAGR